MDAPAAGAVTGVTSIAISAAGVTSNNTTGTAHPNVQPTIVCNYILRII
jgi:microcystin-dependent protein